MIDALICLSPAVSDIIFFSDGNVGSQCSWAGHHVSSFLGRMAIHEAAVHPLPVVRSSEMGIL